MPAWQGRACAGWWQAPQSETQHHGSLTGDGCIRGIHRTLNANVLCMAAQTKKMVQGVRIERRPSARGMGRPGSRCQAALGSSAAIRWPQQPAHIALGAADLPAVVLAPESAQTRGRGQRAAGSGAAGRSRLRPTSPPAQQHVPQPGCWPAASSKSTWLHRPGARASPGVVRALVDEALAAAAAHHLIQPARGCASRAAC